MDSTLKKILIIEDDSSLSLRLRDHLNAIGYSSETCGDGRTGLEHFLNGKFKLVFISTRTKFIHSQELLHHIHTKSPLTPVIAICESNSLSEAVNSIRKGFWDYITPNLGPDKNELVLIIDRVTQLASLRERNLRNENELHNLLDKRTSALKNSEMRYRYLLSTVTDYIYTVRVENNKVISVVHSPGCEAVTGFTPDEYYNDPKLYNRMIFEEDREIVNDATSRVFSEVKPISFEHRIIHKNGSLVWIHATLVPHVNDDSFVDSYDSIISNITERKSAESQIILEDQRNKALLELSHMENQPIEKIMEYALNTGVTLTHSKVGFLYLYDEATKMLTNYAWAKCNYTPSQLPVMEKSFSIEKIGVFGEAIKARRPVILNNNKTSLFHESFRDSESFIRHLTLPIFEGEKIVALVGMGHKRSDYDERDIRHLKLLMDGVWKIKEKNEAVEALKNLNEELEARVYDRTIELNNANQKLLKLSIEDSLTGIANRRRFNEVLEIEINRSKRDEHPLAILMCDIDYFKRYNDNYGHIAGDEILRRVGEVYRDLFKRAGELPARYGGEEFVVILPNTTEEQGYIIAEKLREAIGNLQIVHGFSDASPNLSISIGLVAMLLDDTATATEYINMADEALYEAKNSGRNCVKIFRR